MTMREAIVTPTDETQRALMFALIQQCIDNADCPVFHDHDFSATMTARLVVPFAREGDFIVRIDIFDAERYVTSIECPINIVVDTDDYEVLVSYTVPDSQYSDRDVLCLPARPSFFERAIAR